MYARIQDLGQTERIGPNMGSAKASDPLSRACMWKDTRAGPPKQCWRRALWMRDSGILMEATVAEISPQNAQAPAWPHLMPSCRWQPTITQGFDQKNGTFKGLAREGIALSSPTSSPRRSAALEARDCSRVPEHLVTGGIPGILAGKYLLR